MLQIVSFIFIATKCECNSLVPVQWLLLQNVGAIHWSMFNGYCYKMWVQFIGPCSMVIATKCGCNSTDPCSMVIATKCGCISLVLFNGHYSKCECSSLIPVQWGLLQTHETKCGCNSLVPLQWSLLQKNWCNSMVLVEWTNEFMN
jgi:hypothetical protein